MVTSTVPVPTGWPTIKTAYSGITTKLNESQYMVSTATTKVTTEMKLAAIYYWKRRLDEDAALIAAGQPPATVTLP